MPPTVEDSYMANRSSTSLRDAQQQCCYTDDGINIELQHQALVFGHLCFCTFLRGIYASIDINQTN